MNIANSQAQVRSPTTTTTTTSSNANSNRNVAQQSTAVATTIANSANSANSPATTNSGNCHLRELDLCAASLVVFMQAPSGLATSENEINKQCTHIKEADQCFDNYSRRCLTPMQRQLATLASNSTAQLANDYCTRNSTFRIRYLKHANCLNQVQKKEQKGCMRDVQAGLELIANGLGVTANSNSNGQQQQQQMGAGKRIALACCIFKRFENCFGSQLEKKCGKETVNFVQSTFRSVTSRLPETMCRLYKHDSNECRAILPKSGTIPKGSKSNSIISRLMTAYSGL